MNNSLGCDRGWVRRVCIRLICGRPGRFRKCDSLSDGWCVNWRISLCTIDIGSCGSRPSGGRGGSGSLCGTNSQSGTTEVVEGVCARGRAVDTENHALSAVQLLAAVKPERLGGIADGIYLGWEFSVRVGYRVELSLKDGRICSRIQEGMANFVEAGLNDTLCLKIEKISNHPPIVDECK